MNSKIRYAGREDVLGVFEKLDANTNKGDMGRVLLVCGSYDPHGCSMLGAAYFSALAAYRCGAGIVEIFTARKNYEAIGALLPEAVYSLYEYEESAEDICERLKASIAKASSVVVGCGIGKSKLSKKLLATALELSSIPLVLDADALNILSENKELWSLLSPCQAARTVITPHSAEMSRLTGVCVKNVLADRVGAARDISKKYGIVCLLKGNNTVITDGELTYINKSGNPGMATAGSGDILSGIIGSVLARALPPCYDDREIVQNPVLYKTAVSAYLHGVAGDVAVEEKGEYSMLARDILEKLPCALK